MDSTKLKKQIKKFEEYLIVDIGLAPVTVGGYCRTINFVLKKMRKFCPGYDHVKEHILWMHEKKYSYSHLVNTSIALEHYTRFKGTPVKIGRPKKPKQIIKNVLSESEVTRLIQSTKNIREKALICLLSYTGIRNLEICNLKLEDIDMGDNQVTVRGGKNKKDRMVHMSAECTNVLICYLQSYPKKKDDYLFRTIVKNNPLATGDVRKTLRVIARRAKIERRVYPHLLRHSLATNLLNRGASLMLIKNQLGHAFIESTMIYVVSMPFRTRSEYDFYKPAYM
jgi:integrase/recombinase XerD